MKESSHSPKRHAFGPLLFPVDERSRCVAALEPSQSLAAPAAATSVPSPSGTAEPPASTSTSQVRLRAIPLVAEVDWLDVPDVLDTLREDQLNLNLGLAALARLCAGGPRDPSTRAALATLSLRVRDLSALRDVLGGVLDLANEPRAHRLFAGDAPLAEYLRGLYAWLHVVVYALERLANGLHELGPDWCGFRGRLTEARNFLFDELKGAIRGELERGPPPLPSEPEPEALAFAVERVFGTALAVERRLEERFG